MEKKRDKVVIKKDFQQAVVLETILLMFIILNMIVMMGFLDLEFLKFTDNPRLSFAIVVAFFEVIGFAVVYYISLRSSFRTAGPIYVMESNIKKMTEGDLSFQMRLRKNDHFQELSGEINELVSVLKSRVEVTKDYVEKLEQEVQPDSRAHELTELIHKELSFFQLKENNKDQG